MRIIALSLILITCQSLLTTCEGGQQNDNRNIKEFYALYIALEDAGGVVTLNAIMSKYDAAEWENLGLIEFDFNNEHKWLAKFKSRANKDFIIVLKDDGAVAVENT